jgi:hypothetical protein
VQFLSRSWCAANGCKKASCGAAAATHLAVVEVILDPLVQALQTTQAEAIGCGVACRAASMSGRGLGAPGKPRSCVADCGLGRQPADHPCRRRGDEGAKRDGGPRSPDGSSSAARMERELVASPGCAARARTASPTRAASSACGVGPREGAAGVIVAIYGRGGGRV